MDPPVFKQISDSLLYEIPHSVDNQQFDGWCACLFEEKWESDSITIEHSLNDTTCHYIFMKTRPTVDASNVDEFITQVRKHTENKLGVRKCLWLEGFSETEPILYVKNQFGFKKIPRCGIRTIQGLNYAIGSNISFHICQGIDIEADNEIGLKLKNQFPGICFQTPPLKPTPKITENKYAHLPFFGPYSGRFIVDGEINANTLEYFETGFKFSSENFYQTYPVLNLKEIIHPLNYTGVMNLFNPVNEHITYSCDSYLDTFFAITLPSRAKSNSLILKSWLCTDKGHKLNLIPQINLDSKFPPTCAPSFAFQRNPKNEKNVYLTLAGKFALQKTTNIPYEGSTQNLLCGFFGSELLTFHPFKEGKTYDSLVFVPSCPAYAPDFPSKRTSILDPNLNPVKDLLVDKYQTSWIRLIHNDDTHDDNTAYISQPENNALYYSSGEPPIGILDTLYPQVVLPPNSDLLVPLVPYGGITNENKKHEQDIVNFESQILSPKRRDVVASLTTESLSNLIEQIKLQNSADNKKRVAVTPSGLLVDTETDNTVGTIYHKILLAKFKNTTDDPSLVQELAFASPKVKLIQLFQTNQIFAVIINPDNLGTQQYSPENNDDTPIFFNQIQVDDWKVNVKVGKRTTPTDYHNVMIIKFCEGSLVERIASPDKWTAVDDFSLIPGTTEAEQKRFQLDGLSQWLQDFVSDAITKSKKNKIYKKFEKIVKDPYWNGILVLRADIPPGDLPKQLKGLAAGIDAESFFAHHMGITVNRPKIENSQIVVEESSVFGLIDYEFPLFTQNVKSGASEDVPIGIPITDDFGFTVLQLQVLFENSSMINFKSYIQLSIKEMFGLPISKTAGDFGVTDANAVVLRGYSQKQGDYLSYVFEQKKPTVFEFQSNIFNAITFNQLQFNTLPTSDETVKNQFLIWGNFNFVKLIDSKKNPCDIFSFGTEKFPDELMSMAKGLDFSGLKITMDFPVDSPDQVSYNFVPHLLEFSPNSVPRKNSLVSSLPLKISEFIISTPGKEPLDYGFLPVSVENISFHSLPDQWFGVVFDIEMGTAGSLVENIDFSSKILLAWSPNVQDSNSIAVGIKLPGTSEDSKMLRVQGVLNLSFDDVVLQTSKEGKSFNLMIKNLSLDIFGITKLPPSGRINMFVFGDPKGKGNAAWYAAFNSKTSQLLNYPTLEESS